MEKQAEPARQESPKIGVVLALTGKGATYGNRALHGMELAVEELNRQPAFRARPVRLVVEDSHSKAADALTAFRKLDSVDHVPAAVGFVLSDEVMACAPVANSRQIVLLTTAAGSDAIQSAGDFVFRNRESAAVQAAAIAEECAKRYPSRPIGVLHSTSANGVSYRDAFASALKAQGGSVTSTVGFTDGKSDYRPELLALRRAKTDAVYLAGLDTDLGLILRQAAEMGFRPQFFASAGAISPKLLSLAGTGAEGLICGSAPFNVDAPASKTFVDAYRTRFKDDPDFIAANSYDGVMLVASAISRGATSGSAVRDALYATKQYAGVGGLTSFDSNGEVSKPIGLVQVRKGSFVSLVEQTTSAR